MQWCGTNALPSIVPHSKHLEEVTHPCFQTCLGQQCAILNQPDP